MIFVRQENKESLQDMARHINTIMGRDSISVTKIGRKYIIWFTLTKPQPFVMHTQSFNESEARGYLRGILAGYQHRNMY